MDKNQQLGLEIPAESAGTDSSEETTPPLMRPKDTDPVSSGAQDMQTAAAPRVDIRSSLIGAALAVAIMAPVTFFLMQQTEQRIEDRLASASPIAVLDYAGAVMSFTQNGGTQEDTDGLAARIDGAIDKLSAAGFVVLSSRAVLKAPPSNYIPLSMILDSAPSTSAPMRQDQQDSSELILEAGEGKGISLLPE